jgi:phage terminase small subunit
MSKLTPKRQCFVERFCIHVISLKAARKAGFSAKTEDASLSKNCSFLRSNN